MSSPAFSVGAIESPSTRTIDSCAGWLAVSALSHRSSKAKPGLPDSSVTTAPGPAETLTAFLLLQALGDAAADELLNVSRIAAEHPRQTGEVFAALGAEALKDEAGIVHH